MEMAAASGGKALSQPVVPCTKTPPKHNATYDNKGHTIYQLGNHTAYQLGNHSSIAASPHAEFVCRYTMQPTDTEGKITYSIIAKDAAGHAAPPITDGTAGATVGGSAANSVTGLVYGRGPPSDMSAPALINTQPGKEATTLIMPAE
eukprot:COSAG01_NODE_42259_length_441_cov_52.464912_1_plen_146_part_11